MRQVRVTDCVALLSACGSPLARHNPHPAISVRATVTPSTVAIVGPRHGSRHPLRHRADVAPARAFRCQTCFRFHWPRRKITALTTASVENAIITAQYTPLGPMPDLIARK